MSGTMALANGLQEMLMASDVVSVAFGDSLELGVDL